MGYLEIGANNIYLATEPRLPVMHRVQYIARSAKQGVARQTVMLAMCQKFLTFNSKSFNKIHSCALSQIVIQIGPAVMWATLLEDDQQRIQRKNTRGPETNLLATCQPLLKFYSKKFNKTHICRLYEIFIEFGPAVMSATLLENGCRKF